MKAISQVGSFQEAQRKARFGHREWIGYTVKSTGSRVYEKLTAESIRRAMLMNGTQKKMTVIYPDGVNACCPFWMANNIRRQFVLGYR